MPRVIRSRRASDAAARCRSMQRWRSSHSVCGPDLAVGVDLGPAATLAEVAECVAAVPVPTPAGQGVGVASDRAVERLGAECVQAASE